MSSISDIKSAGYAVGKARSTPDADVYSISGKGFSGLMVSINPNTGDGLDEIDRDVLVSLTDPVTRVERDFQSDRPDAHQARVDLIGKGYEVERPDPNVNVFEIVEKDGAASVAQAVSPDQLIEQAEDLPDLQEAKRSP